jgi:hypothetical protein
MAKHTDKYGREWFFTPAHDADNMVKIPREVMERFILADRICEGRTMLGDYAGYFASMARVECYVLRLPGLGACTGARFSDEGQDYYSSLVNDSHILLKMLQCVRVTDTDLKNLQALADLFPRLGDNSLDL